MIQERGQREYLHRLQLGDVVVELVKSGRGHFGHEDTDHFLSLIMTGILFRAADVTPLSG